MQVAIMLQPFFNLKYTFSANDIEICDRSSEAQLDKIEIKII